MFTQASAAAGFRVRWTECATLEELHDRRRPSLIEPGASLRGEWDEVHYFDWAYILEDDHIRVLPRTKALAFWKQWWADEQAGKSK